MDSILFVGSSGVGTSQLLTALRRASPFTSDADNSNPDSLRLDTKYYTAGVLLRTADTQHQLSRQPEALVLVFAANDQKSFANVQQWSQKHDTDDIEVKLAVANKADLLQQSSGTSKPQWLEDAISWCYESGYEYIETAAAYPNIDRNLQLDGDQQGVARVLAALQAHMWPGMAEKQWQRPALTTINLDTDSSQSTSLVNGLHGSDHGGTDGTANEVPAATNGTAAASGPPSTGGQQQQQQDEHLAAAAASPGTSGTLENEPKQQQQQQEEEDLTQQASRSAPHHHHQQQQQQQPQLTSADDASIADQEGFLEDIDIDDFEKLMKQVQGARARLSGLSDVDRRTAAADMAMRLAELMGLEDSDGESDRGQQQLLQQ